MWKWELDHEKRLSIKEFMLLNCGAAEDSWESLDIKLVNPKGNQPWILMGMTDAKSEPPIFWPSDVKSWFIGKDPDVGKDWRLQKKGVAEDEMII